MQQHGSYAFKVGRKATKPQIKKMFEMMYSTKVARVQVALVPAKTRLVRGKKILTKRPVYKKAIITIKKGEKPVDLNKFKLTTKAK